MAVEFKDYYQILGVPRSASEEEIKQAFRKLARKHHPDVAKDKKAAEEKFKEINEAYEVLGNPENRRKYDALGAHWKHGAEFRPPPGWHQHVWRTAPGGEGWEEFEFGGTGFSDFFEQFFGGMGASRFGGASPFRGGGWMGAEDEIGAQRGRDIEGDVLVTLEEVLRGSDRHISVRHRDPRTGESRTLTYRVRIPAGVQEGQRIRLAGKGEVGAAGAGDLYLRVKFAQHPDFRVSGADLYHDLELAPWEAVLGATVEMPTLDGTASLRIPAGTTHGQQLRLRGKGLPTTGGPRGDLYAVVCIQTPTQVSAEERKLWEQLA
ncbi:MAG: J domain-containing protein, partial [Verrucomicrobiae bacterium]|nr:J domain-containing protein [Verrucomicrobiae bacterium]